MSSTVGVSVRHGSIDIHYAVLGAGVVGYRKSRVRNSLV